MTGHICSTPVQVTGYILVLGTIFDVLYCGPVKYYVCCICEGFLGTKRFVLPKRFRRECFVENHETIFPYMILPWSWHNITMIPLSSWSHDDHAKISSSYQNLIMIIPRSSYNTVLLYQGPIMMFPRSYLNLAMLLDHIVLSESWQGPLWLWQNPTKILGRSWQDPLMTMARSQWTH